MGLNIPLMNTSTLFEICTLFKINHIIQKQLEVNISLSLPLHWYRDFHLESEIGKPDETRLQS